MRERARLSEQEGHGRYGRRLPLALLLELVPARWQRPIVYGLVGLLLLGVLVRLLLPGARSWVLTPLIILLLVLILPRRRGWWW